jgi:hypothetical protein
LIFYDRGRVGRKKGPIIIESTNEDQGNKLQLWTLVLEIARFLMELGRLLFRAAKPITSRKGGLQVIVYYYRADR